MSGGQQQRVAIARGLLVHDPPLLLADEPTAHLDHIQVEGVHRLVRQLAESESGRLVVIATHDDRITHLADRVIELAPGFTHEDTAPRTETLQAGELLFEQGERATLIYVVESGRLEIFRQLADGAEQHLDEVSAGNYFGELGPLLSLPRSASARAITDSVVIGYSVRAFRRAFPGAVPAEVSRLRRT